MVCICVCLHRANPSTEQQNGECSCGCKFFNWIPQNIRLPPTLCGFCTSRPLLPGIRGCRDGGRGAVFIFFAVRRYKTSCFLLSVIICYCRNGSNICSERRVDRRKWELIPVILFHINTARLERAVEKIPVYFQKQIKASRLHVASLRQKTDGKIHAAVSLTPCLFF